MQTETLQTLKIIWGILTVMGPVKTKQNSEIEQGIPIEYIDLGIICIILKGEKAGNL